MKDEFEVRAAELSGRLEVGTRGEGTLPKLSLSFLVWTTGWMDGDAGR